MKEEQIAFIYRLHEREEITTRLLREYSDDNYFLEFPGRLILHISKANKENFKQVIDEFFQQEEDVRNVNIPIAYHIYNISSIKTELTDSMSHHFTTKVGFSQNDINRFFNFIETKISEKQHSNESRTRLYQFASKKACKKYFGNYFKRQQKAKENLDVLCKTKKLYCPPGGAHTWDANLRWLLDCLHDGRQFIIMSEINKQSKLRSSGKKGSGFYREISVCHKQGYILEKANGEIIMRHPRINILRKLTFDDINMSDNEMKQHFKQAIEEYKILKNKLVAAVRLPIGDPVVHTIGILETTYINKELSDQIYLKLTAQGIDRTFITIDNILSASLNTPDTYRIRIKSYKKEDFKTIESVLSSNLTQSVAPATTAASSSKIKMKR